jgi:hypothetical protein
VSDRENATLMKVRFLRSPLILLPLLSALAGGASAGSIPALIAAPPVGPAARSPFPAAPGGTVTTPVTPTVPPSPTPGKSTITLPGASGPGAASTVNPGTVRPCGAGSSAAGTIPGNAGIATAPGENPNNVATGVPTIPSGGTPNAGGATTTNPSVRPGVPSSC